jgi:transposase
MLNDVQFGDLLKVLWYDGQGLGLFAKRLEKGRFVWPSPADGKVVISPAQLGMLLEGIDWRMPATDMAAAAGRLIRHCDKLTQPMV